MKFSHQLIKGTLVRRYKRFMADIELEKGNMIVAHCPNPGSMRGLKDPDSEVWLSVAENPKRKLKFTWEMIRIGKSLVGINTNRSNAIDQEAISNNVNSELSGYESHRREVNFGKNSRIDILLESPNRSTCYVEVKNVTLKRNRLAEFPDSITARGTKHLGELTKQVKAGNRAVMFYLVQREDCEGFAIADDIDTSYAEAHFCAVRSGVEILCYQCKLTPKRIDLDIQLSVRC